MPVDAGVETEAGMADKRVDWQVAMGMPVDRRDMEPPPPPTAPATQPLEVEGDGGIEMET